MTRRSMAIQALCILAVWAGLAFLSAPACAQFKGTPGKGLPQAEAESAEQAKTPAGPCYLRFTCSGRTTALCNPATPVYEDLATLHIPISADEPTPNIHLLRYGYADQMAFFDRECNQRRYARTDFSCATNGLWSQDSHDQWVSLAKVCTDGSCQKDGGPCRSNTDCCPGNHCHPQLKTCKSLKKDVPGTQGPSQNQ